MSYSTKYLRNEMPGKDWDCAMEISSMAWFDKYLHGDRIVITKEGIRIEFIFSEDSYFGYYTMTNIKPNNSAADIADALRHCVLRVLDGKVYNLWEQECPKPGNTIIYRLGKFVLRDNPDKPALYLPLSSIIK